MQEGLTFLLFFRLDSFPEWRPIVAQIEREQAPVRANRELVELFEGKIKAHIAKVWGEDV